MEEADSIDSALNAYPGGECTEATSEDGEVKREESTLLERSLVSAASISRPFDSQGMS